MKGQSYYLIVAMLLIAILSNTLIDGKKTIPKSKNIHKKTDDDNVNKNGNKDVIDDEAYAQKLHLIHQSLPNTNHHIY